MATEYDRLPSFDEHNGDTEDALLGETALDWNAVENLDTFFVRLYHYWEQKGLAVILTARVLNLLALAFTIAISTVLLLFVDWGALSSDCIIQETCDVWDVAFHLHPFADGFTFWKALCLIYLAIFTSYLGFAALHLVQEAKGLIEVRHFYSSRMGLSDRQIRTVSWPEVVARLVAAQSSTRLSIAKDLTEQDVVARIMRRENYLIGMLNKGVLALNIPLPGLRRHLVLTKTLEWNVYWCVLDAMFDDRFTVKQTFLRDKSALQRRFKTMAVINACFSPFLLVFLVIYFFMKNAEAFYHHPSTLGNRRWSPLARWKLREFNELPCFLTHRLSAGHAAAEKYVSQFPNPVVSHIARFVAFVAGSFAALLLALTLLDERLLEHDLAMGRQTVWWLALLGVLLAVSRSMIVEESTTAFDPGLALLEVAAHTHHMPRRWRGGAHTREVHSEFQSLFQFKALLFLEELSSVVLTPVFLWTALPTCAGAILAFVDKYTEHIEGVGDVCSLSTFDFRKHGNPKYASPCDAPKASRSRHGKMEKSFVSFATAYRSWRPSEEGKQLLSQVLENPAAAEDPKTVQAVQAVNGSPILGQYPLLSALSMQYSHSRQVHGIPMRIPAPWTIEISPPDPTSNIFASADFMPPGGLAPVEAAERVAVSQLLLQSYHDNHVSGVCSQLEEQGLWTSQGDIQQQPQRMNELAALSRENSMAGNRVGAGA